MADNKGVTTNRMSNGDGATKLDLLRQDLDRLLQDEGVTAKEMMRGQLRAIRDFIPFLVQQQQDHETLEDLKPWYRWGRWVILIVGGIGLTDLVTRLLTVAASVVR